MTTTVEMDLMKESSAMLNIKRVQRKSLHVKISNVSEINIDVTVSFFNNFESIL